MKAYTLFLICCLMAVFLPHMGISLNMLNFRPPHTKRAVLPSKHTISYTSTDTSKLRNAYLEAKISSIIEQEHYAPKRIDDSLSKHLFTQYLLALDYEKSIFLEKDINYLKKFIYDLDNEILQQQFSFLYEVDKIYNERIAYIQGIYPSMLKTPFNYAILDSIEFNENNYKYPKTLKELEKKWHKKLKFMALQRYYDALQQRKKYTYMDSITHTLVAKDTSYKIKADSTLEREARDKIQRVLKKLFIRYQKRASFQEKVDVFLNVFCTYMDPHTNYLPPLDKRSFNESMSKRFYGIGAQLTEDNDMGMKITRIITGGAAWKSRQLQQGDVIVKVAQDGDDFEDLAGYDIEEAVKLIRGDKNTKLRLGVRKSNGKIIEVSLIREEVKQEESLARSAVIQEGNKKIGYLYLPDFYADFEDRNGSQSSYDVALEIEKLKRENVEGIIMDLRNNGGGSLSDVLQIVGYFIFKGPVVQVKDKKNKTNVLYNNLGLLLYSGPLIVMVNEFSASASEIFAAAIQDYHRGLIVGTTTYGKGTVQKQLDLKLPPFLETSNIDKQLGGLKLTVQKFYRINGGSTQLKGVEPDIVLPSRYEYAKIRERDSKNILRWDEIPKTDYKEWEYNPYDRQAIIEQERKRIANSHLFYQIDKNALWLAKQRDRTRSLNFKLYVEQEEESKKIYDSIDAILGHNKDSLSVQEVVNFDPIDTTQMINEEDREKWKAKTINYQEWIKAIRKDIYLMETAKIMGDIISVGSSGENTSPLLIDPSTTTGMTNHSKK